MSHMHDRIHIKKKNRKYNKRSHTMYNKNRNKYFNQMIYNDLYLNKCYDNKETQ